MITGKRAEVSGPEAGFRREVRAWLEEVLPSDWGPRRRPASTLAGRMKEGKAWQRMVYQGGFGGLGLPADFGGRPASATERLIFAEECARARAPEPADIFGQFILAPTLLALGTKEQKERFLPPIIRGEVMWCETFSEPDNGSDMANIQCRAELDGDELVVTGRKRWNSLSQFADWTMLLCRTGAPDSRGRGITFALVDLRSPGVRIETMPMLTGDDRETEVFWDEVRVPIANVVSAVDDGWRVAMSAMTTQRSIGTAELVPRLAVVVEDLVELATRTTAAGGRPAIEDPFVRDGIARCATDVAALRRTGERAMAAAAMGSPLGPEVSIAKLHWSETEQRLHRLAVELLGLRGLLIRDDEDAVDEGFWAHYWLWTHALTIHSGTSEIQRNIIAQRVLGLPVGR
ncbi:MAG TPA: acyl-CoA dehydrogenase family protein [Pseudonocardia sp.]|nr:acyl-CoA dehydrogenase family protein [Pseudonocardia sp.]